MLRVTKFICTTTQGNHFIGSPRPVRSYFTDEVARNTGIVFVDAVRNGGDVGKITPVEVHEGRRRVTLVPFPRFIDFCEGRVSMQGIIEEQYDVE